MFKLILKTLRKLNLGKVLTALGVLYAVLEVAHAIQKSTGQDKAETAKNVLDAIKNTV